MQEVSVHVPNPEAPKPKPFCVFFPGATGGGEGLTAIRRCLTGEFGKENILAPSSYTTPEAHKKGVGYKQRIKDMANQIIVSNKIDVHVVSHSLGSFEAVDLVSELTGMGFQGKIVLDFIGTPGLFDKGIGAVTRFARRFVGMVRDITVSEQHTAYPLPDQFYQQNEPERAGKNFTSLWQDSDQKRAERRQLFIESLQSLVPDQKEREELIENVNKKDRELLEESDPQRQAQIVQERAELIKGVIQDMFANKHIEEEERQAYVAYNGETKEEQSRILATMAQVAGFYATAALRSRKISRQIRKMYQEAAKKEIDLNLHCVLLERDNIVQVGDNERTQAEDIADFVTADEMIQTLSHSTFGYYATPLVDVFNRHE